MLGAVFYWVLNMSILSSLVGVIVLGLRRLRKLPRFGIYLLWLLPFIRFWIPLGLANKYSLLSLLSKYTTKTLVIWKSGPGSPEFTMSNSLQGASKYLPFVYKTDLLKEIFDTAGVIWAIVTIVILLGAIAFYMFAKSAIKDALPIKDDIYRSQKLSSPAVYGIIRPRIILPADIADSDREYIVKHERVHIRRRDNLWRMAAIITACCHWFNPLSWVFLKCFLIDMELACDTAVLRKIPENEKNRYAAALLSCAANRTYYASAFSGVKTRRRIDNILSYKKLTFFSSLCFAIFFIIVFITMVTNAAGG